MSSVSREVRGSTGNVYLVEIERRGDLVTARCSCKAGEMSNVCKHLLGVVAQSDATELIAGSEFADALKRYETAQSAKTRAELEVAEAKALLRSALRR